MPHPDRTPLALALALASCQPTPEVASPVERVAVEATPAIEPRPTEVTVEEPSTAPIDPALRAVIEPAAAVPQWHRVVAFAHDASEPELLQSGDGAVYAALGPALVQLRDDGSATPVTMAGLEPMADHAEWLDGDLVSYRRTRIGGRISANDPGGFLVVEYEFGARGENPPPQSYRMDAGRWRRLPGASRFWAYPRAFAPWKGGALLGLRGFVPTYAYAGRDDEDPVPAREVQAAARAIAAQKQLVVLAGRPTAPALTWSGTAVTMTALPSGEILVALDDDRGASVLHYDDARGASILRPLPAGLGDADRVVLAMRSARDAWLSGPYLAHFDGEAWTRVDTPCDGGPVALALGPDAELVACTVVAEGGLRAAAVLQRAADSHGEAAPWQAIGLPAALRDAELRALVVQGDRVLVLAAPEGTGASIWSTGPAPVQPYAFGDTRTTTAAILEAADDLPITRTCGEIFVPFTAPRGTAHADALARIDDVAGNARTATVRVRGEVVDGIIVTGLRRGEAQRDAARIAAALGTEVGEPTCNVRPAI